MVNTEPLQHWSNNCFRQDSQRDAKISTESPKEEEDTYISKYSGEQPDAISLRVSDSLVSCISLMLSRNTGSLLWALCLKDKKRKVEDNFEVWEKNSMHPKEEMSSFRNGGPESGQAQSFKSERSSRSEE